MLIYPVFIYPCLFTHVNLPRVYLPVFIYPVFILPLPGDGVYSGSHAEFSVKSEPVAPSLPVKCDYNDGDERESHPGLLSSVLHPLTDHFISSLLHLFSSLIGLLLL